MMKPPTNLLFERTLEGLLPEFSTLNPKGRGFRAGKVCATIEALRNPVFGGFTVHLSAKVDGEGEAIHAKHTISELVLEAAQTAIEGQMLIAAAITEVCGLLAPRLYEHDPRVGMLVSSGTGLSVPPHLLFDPPGVRGPAVYPNTNCAVCGALVIEPLSPMGTVAVWGGGNLGFLHPKCCSAVGVSLRP